MTRLLGRIGLGLLLALALAWWISLPSEPDAFYAAPQARPAPPGALLRQATFARDVPAGTRAWRILYATTDGNGRPATASAIVMVSERAPSGPRPVISWTHGTTGAATGCAPSLLAHPFANVPALPALLEQGWIYLATDYAGLGTAGPHPYLIGEGEARSTLDAVRALRHVQGVTPGRATVVWGHSQGGHAALWTGILAPSYAPDVELLGVAAIAPASDLRPLLEAAQHTPVGRILSAYVLRSYGAIHDDVALHGYASAPKRLLARDMARRCLAGPGALLLVGEALLAGGTLFATPPSTGPLGARLAQDTPSRAIGVPLLVAQGAADELVLPGVQARFVRERCAAGQALEYRLYPGRDHLSIVAPGSPLHEDLVRWSRDRFRHASWSAACP